MSREGAIKLEGVVVEVLNDRLYRIELPNGHRLLGHMGRVPCSVLRASEKEARNTQHTARGLVAGEKVTVEMSPFDFSKGRISLPRT